MPPVCKLICLCSLFSGLTPLLIFCLGMAPGTHPIWMASPGQERRQPQRLSSYQRWRLPPRPEAAQISFHPPAGFLPPTVPPPPHVLQEKGNADGQALRLFGDGWSRQQVLFLLHLVLRELSAELLPTLSAALLPGRAGARENRIIASHVVLAEPSLTHPQSGICSPLSQQPAIELHTIHHPQILHCLESAN